jgi:5-methyltetrahydropteroyltriglutamate--homocysteine methyltransferase
MELLLASTGSYPRVGDTPEEQILRRTIAQWEKGEKTDADLATAQDRMTEMAMEEQTAAGLDVVTDGQVRWYDPVSHLAGKMSGVQITGLLRFFDTNVYFRQPVVRAKPARKGALLVEEFRFAQQRSERPVKVVMTGPYTLAHLSLAEDGLKGGSETLREGYTEALAEEVGALVEAGATLIQVDEPALLKNPGDFARVEQSLKQLAARKGAAQLELALYFGDPAPLYERLQKLPVDVLGLDFTYNPGLTGVISGAGSARELALGLVDGRNTRLEDPAAVARQMGQIFRKLPAARAYLAPSCGLEYLPRDRARLKLENLTTIKKTFLGSHA